MALGDCLVFHAMIVHGAPGNDTAGARRRGLSLRYTGDDARYDPRPGTHVPVPAQARPRGRRADDLRSVSEGVAPNCLDTAA
jgi:ectoine hydroxylase-related dioxygenase (phytanoyl-CoA dioxygenase family)